MSIYEHDLIHIDKSEFKSDILNEAYIGKTPILLDIEKKIHILRKNISMFKDNNSSKILLEIDKLFEKQFGMDIYVLDIMPDKSVDCMTSVVGRYFDMIERDMRSYVEGNAVTGYRFKKKNGLCTITKISYGLLSDKRYSDALIVAILLHEIGHQFSCCLYNELELYNRDIMKQYRDMLVASASLYAVDVIEKYGSMDWEYKTNKENRKHPKSHKVKAFINGIKGNLSDKTYNFFDVLARYSGLAVKYANDEKKSKDKSVTMNSLDRHDEIFADKFAVIYGYGLELAQVNVIFDDIVHKKDYQLTRKLGKKAQKMNDAYEEAIFDINDFDEHPNSLQRINNVLTTLNREFEKDDIDPRVKNELDYQIKEVQKIIKDMISISTKKYRIEKKRALYLSYIQNTAPDALTDEINEKIEEILDKALEEQEKNHK